jgi:hypothetical protein
LKLRAGVSTPKRSHETPRWRRSLPRAQITTLIRRGRLDVGLRMFYLCSSIDLEARYVGRMSGFGGTHRAVERFRRAPVVRPDCPLERENKPYRIGARRPRGHAPRVAILFVARPFWPALCLFRLFGVGMSGLSRCGPLSGGERPYRPATHVSVRATGSFPEPIVKRTELELRAYGGKLEFHVHLLASSPANREVALADLAAASP